VRASWEPLRRAGAIVRTMLVSAAAQAWDVTAQSCRAEKGEVIHAATGSRLNYGALVDSVAALPVPADVTLKDLKNFTLIATSAKRLDTPDKVNGKAQFSIDVKVPGMKIASVAACPVFGGRLVSVDDSKARMIKGVHQVLLLDNAVAVVGEHTWAAKQGLAALDIQWDEGPNATLSTGEIIRQLEAALLRPGVIARKDGDVARSCLGPQRRSRPYTRCRFSPMQRWSR
jgi:isoquinoline 1-oxidoreductase beta subunit